jgi:cytochrome c peroxidase
LREGSVATLEMQILVPIQESNEFDHNIVDISYQLREDSSYVAQSMEAYGRLPDPFVITRAIATFERTLISGRSPYDQYVYQGCNSALSPMAKKGMDLFFGEKAACGNCHGGFNLTNYAFENNGLYVEYADPGRFRFTGDSADLATFKVPSLRNVAVTAPYMHDGSVGSLQAVIEHYDAGGAGHKNQSPLVRPLQLTALEKEALLAFLLSLTDEAFINQPAFRQ